MKDIFKVNEYPQQYVEKCKKLFKKLFVPKKVRQATTRKDFVPVLLFLIPLSLAIRTHLKKYLKNYTPYCSLEIV